MAAIDYKHDDKYPQFANDVRDWIDERVHGTLGSAYRGALSVLSAGFGKGVLAMAALATAAFVATAIFAPAALNLAPGLPVAQLAEQGLLTAGNMLLGHPIGYMALFVGGATGSLIEAHSENDRIGKEAALAQAVQYAHLREARVPQLQHSMDKNISLANCEAKGGHCERLLREQQTQREMAR
ncbi:MAG: hypothetical protein SFX19_05585 [Alphaproteobacteria bacterium]|nr:hypothetical protein [Alphaproteobacteria bacterium]